MGRKRKAFLQKRNQMKVKRAKVEVHTEMANSGECSSSNFMSSTNNVERRQALFNQLSPIKSELIPVADQYIMISQQVLQLMFSKCSCSACGQNGVSLAIDNANGFSCNLVLSCSACDFTFITSSSKRLDENKKCSGYEVNRRATLAFTKLGKGHAGMEMFSTVMNMNGLSSRSFSKHVRHLQFASKNTAQHKLQSVRSIVRSSHLELNSSIVSCSEEPLDISVSYDASWQKRGHASDFGVGCVVDLLTGYVIDYEVLSKVCQSCIIAEKDFGKDSAEFNIWMQGHSPECEINYKGSSGGMEAEIASILWKRSLDNGFRYTTLLGDGDAKTFMHLHKMQIYGPDVKIQKEECINHVGKRMGTALRNLVASERKKGNRLGGKKHGQLKDVTIKKITRYYQNAIRSNKTVDSMKTSIYAILCHCSSTDLKPNHQKCPSGNNSWCFYNRMIAQGKKPSSHIKNVSTALSPSIVVKMMPVFQRLASNDLLQRCTMGRTQNANESLHQLFWAKCPKTIHTSKKRVDIAVADSITEFNQGLASSISKMQEEANLFPGEISLQLARRKDKRRYRKSMKSSQASFKKYRRKVALAKLCLQEREKKSEGASYKPGSF